MEDEPVRFAGIVDDVVVRRLGELDSRDAVLFATPGFEGPATGAETGI